jgi:sulfur dioxygenase
MKPYIFQQLFDQETSTYTYILADADTRDAVVIDPVFEKLDRDLQLIGEIGLRLVYSIETHVHADHVTASGELRKHLGLRTVVSAGAKIDCADIALKDGDELVFGKFRLKAIATPGHTDSCMSYYIDGTVFTGDALLIRGCGRTDFQQGDSRRLFQSVREKLFRLPPETIVYPAHDYRGITSSTIVDEMKNNPRLGLHKTEAEFVKIMSQLKLAEPKRIHEAVPANLACGSKAGL